MFEIFVLGDRKPVAKASDYIDALSLAFLYNKAKDKPISIMFPMPCGSQVGFAMYSPDIILPIVD